LDLEVLESSELVKAPKPARQEAVKHAMNYMEKSGAQRVLSQMVQQLMIKQPEDPLNFIADLIAAQRSEAQVATDRSMRISKATELEKQQRADGAQAPQGSVLSSRIPDFTGHFSLLAEAMKKTPSLYDELHGKITSRGVRFADIIRPGVENKGHRMIKSAGLVAGDADCFTIFQGIFDAVLGLRYGQISTCGHQPCCLDVAAVDPVGIDTAGGHVVSVNVRVSRNLERFRFPPACSQDERREVERVLTSALCDLDGECQGNYYPLSGSTSFATRPSGMTIAEEVELESHRALFWEPDSAIAISSGVGREWPDARGVFFASSGRCWAWLNEEDHLRLFSSRSGSDLRAAFGQLCRVNSSLVQSLQQQGHTFARNDRLGFLTTGPANVGTGLCATVFMRLPLLSAQPDFRSTCWRLCLQAHQSEIDIWAFSNSERLGSSEAAQVSAIIAACRELVELEVKLASLPAGLREETHACTHAHKEEEEEEDPYPEFLADPCPESLPDLERHCSLAAEVLRRDPSLYSRLKNTKTKNGVTFAKVVKPGVVVKGHAMIKSMGAIAGDEESYEAFAEFFDQLICLSHSGFSQDMQHRASRLVGLDLGGIDTSGSCVITMNIEASRNLQGIRLPPSCSLDERREVERLCVQALTACGASGDCQYYPLQTSNSWSPGPNGMTDEEAVWLSDACSLPSYPSSGVSLASGFGRHWPDARGIFSSRNLDLVASINDEDHLLFSARSSGSDLGALFSRFRSLRDALQTSLAELGHRFMHSKRLGYLTSCPSKLGAGMRVSIRMRLPHLGARRDFRHLCRMLQMDARKCDAGASGDWELSSRSVLGMSEVYLVRLVADGCRHIVQMEEALRQGRLIVLPGLGSSPSPGLFQLGKPWPAHVLTELLGGHRCIGAQVLHKDPTIYSTLQHQRTRSGVPFSLVVKGVVDVFSGGEAEGIHIGLVAGDAECYDAFSSAFAPALEAFHGVLPTSKSPHPAMALNPRLVSDWPLDFGEQQVLSVRLRLARSLVGLRLLPLCSLEERREVERVLVGALSDLTGTLRGEYYPLCASSSHPSKPGGMSTDDERRLRSSDVLFGEPRTPLKLSIGLGRDWPDARGVFVSGGKEDQGTGSMLCAWINEDEHLSLIVRQTGSGDISSSGVARRAFDQLCSAEHHLQAALQQQGRGFARSQRWGFITALPERLGTGLSVSVRLKLPRLTAAPEIGNLCAAEGLQITARAPGGVIEVSNRVSLGVSEVELVNLTMAACARLVAADQG